MAMYTYSATLIHVRKWILLIPFFILSILVVGRLAFHPAVARFSVKWVGPRTFRAFVLWKQGTAISAFRRKGIHGYVLRNAGKWIDWHAHTRGLTHDKHMRDRSIRWVLRVSKRRFFEPKIIRYK